MSAITTLATVRIEERCILCASEQTNETRVTMQETNESEKSPSSLAGRVRSPRL